MAKLIKLTHGKYAIVDDEDYEFLNQYKWHVRKGKNTFYALANIRGEDGKILMERMHRLLLQKKRKDSSIIDHKNGNGLDNRKNNLRLCNQNENNFNSLKRKNCSSIYKGVSFDTKRKRWAAYIQSYGKKIDIGKFDTEDEAAIAYNTHALQIHGQFAKLNIIQKR